MSRCWQVLPIWWNQSCPRWRRRVCQSAWEAFWIIASYTGSLLFFLKKTLCSVTHLEVVNLSAKEVLFFPLTCFAQEHICPAEAAPVWRTLQPLPPLHPATCSENCSSLHILAYPCSVRCVHETSMPSSEPFLLQGPGSLTAVACFAEDFTEKSTFSEGGQGWLDF